MAIGDDVKTAMRDFVTAQLATIAASPTWPVPGLSTDVGLDRDAYQGIRGYNDENAYLGPRAQTAKPVRRRLGVDAVWLERVIHVTDLSSTEVDFLKISRKPKGSDWAGTAWASLGQLAATARLIQVEDLLRAIAERITDGAEPHDADAPDEPDLLLIDDILETNIKAMQPLGRVVLVTMKAPSDKVSVMIKKHDQLLDYYPFHDSPAKKPPHAEIVSAYLVGGTPPLALRYLAQDLEVSVADHEDGLRVTVEERRGWWTPQATRLVAFKNPL